MALVHVRRRPRHQTGAVTRSPGSTMAIKILITANALYVPHGGPVGGGDKRFIEIFKRLKREEGFYVELMTVPSGSEAAAREGLSGVIYHHLPALLASSPIGIAVDYVMRLPVALFLSTKLRSRFDIVYNSTDVLTDVLPAFWLRWLDRCGVCCWARCCL